MPIEIERKFLVRDDGWRAQARPGCRLSQGYAAHGQSCTLRVRLADDQAWLTIKGNDPGLSRAEFEYEIPPAEAEEMLRTLCPQPVLSKTRYLVPHDGMMWEVDVFEGHAAGLVMAEVELAAPDQAITLPPWAGREVTHDPAYRNSAIAERGPPATAGD